MKMLSLFKWLGIVVVALLLSGCFNKATSWKQKTTVVVETPSGVTLPPT
jgi:lipoprotein NlpI